jgi:hypothetical protein
MELLKGIDLIIDNIDNEKWWRLIDLRGMKLKLKKPISYYAHPEFKGDRNFIIANSYAVNSKSIGYRKVNQKDEITPIYYYSDEVVYSNEFTIADTKHTINLSLVDLDYLIKKLKNNV